MITERAIETLESKRSLTGERCHIRRMVTEKKQLDERSPNAARSAASSSDNRRTSPRLGTSKKSSPSRVDATGAVDSTKSPTRKPTKTRSSNLKSGSGEVKRSGSTKGSSTAGADAAKAHTVKEPTVKALTVRRTVRRLVKKKVVAPPSVSDCAPPAAAVSVATSTFEHPEQTPSKSASMYGSYPGSLPTSDLRQYRRTKERRYMEARTKGTKRQATSLYSASKRTRCLALLSAVDLMHYPLVTDQLQCLQFPCRAYSASMQQYSISDPLVTERMNGLQTNPKAIHLMKSLTKSGGIFTSRDKLALYFNLINVYNPEYLVQSGGDRRLPTTELDDSACPSTDACSEPNGVARRSHDSNSDVGECRVFTRRMRRAESQRRSAGSDDSACTEVDGNLESSGPPPSPSTPKRGRPRKHVPLPLPEGSEGIGHNMGSIAVASVYWRTSFFHNVMSSELAFTENMIAKSSRKCVDRFLEPVASSCGGKTVKPVTTLERSMLSEELRDAISLPIAARVKSYVLNRLRSVLWWKCTAGDDTTMNAIATATWRHHGGIPESIKSNIELAAAPVSQTPEFVDEEPRAVPGSVRMFDEVLEEKLRSSADEAVTRFSNLGILVPLVVPIRPNSLKDLPHSVYRGVQIVNRGWLAPELQALYEMLELDDPSGLDSVIDLAYGCVDRAPVGLVTCEGVASVEAILEELNSNRLATGSQKDFSAG
eukprot:GHVH01012111.1.p1 GENE.GHVH01012111.1~~GHVH01012111.1.p1  ORF type:complete len:711 (-),score=84.69 GHVH01012111.1:269-2401(-)